MTATLTNTKLSYHLYHAIAPIVGWALVHDPSECVYCATSKEIVTKLPLTYQPSLTTPNKIGRCLFCLLLIGSTTPSKAEDAIDILTTELHSLFECEFDRVLVNFSDYIPTIHENIVNELKVVSSMMEFGANVILYTNMTGLKSADGQSVDLFAHLAQMSSNTHVWVLMDFQGARTCCESLTFRQDRYHFENVGHKSPDNSTPSIYCLVQASVMKQSWIRDFRSVFMTKRKRVSVYTLLSMMFNISGNDFMLYSNRQLDQHRTFFGLG